MVFAAARIGVALMISRVGDVQSSALSIFREYLDVLIVASLIALLLLTFVLRPFSIPSLSMAPTLQIGDVVLVNELDYRVHRPQIGDVAVFTAPVTAGGTDFIKRVIGVPGDTIRISGGMLYRNGTAVREPYVADAAKYDLEIKNYSIYVNGAPLDMPSANIPPRAQWARPDRIPSGFYFMLGDNRNNSEDSHVWGFAQESGKFVSGPLSHSSATAAFTGRAFLVFWPLDRLHIVR